MWRLLWQVLLLSKHDNAIMIKTCSSFTSFTWLLFIHQFRRQLNNFVRMPSCGHYCFFEIFFTVIRKTEGINTRRFVFMNPSLMNWNGLQTRKQWNESKCVENCSGEKPSVYVQGVNDASLRFKNALSISVEASLGLFLAVQLSIVHPAAHQKNYTS